MAAEQTGSSISDNYHYTRRHSDITKRTNRIAVAKTTEELVGGVGGSILHTFYINESI